MSYVLHFYRMIYKTYDMQEYILFIPRNDIQGKLIHRDFSFFILQWRENEPVLGGFAPPATGRTTAVFSMVLGFILAKTLCPQRHSKVCFELLETFWVTPKRTCLSVICSSVVGQLRWKEHIKKHKRFLFFLIDILDFIILCKIRNNDRTIAVRR